MHEDFVCLEIMERSWNSASLLSRLDQLVNGGVYVGVLLEGLLSFGAVPYACADVSGLRLAQYNSRTQRL